MITGFNTDVRHQNQVYHVQTEDRGTKDNPVVESLIYIGGTIIAKKLTPYADKLHDGATEGMIASLLKRQHQVIIAAIKAGRIEDLIKHSVKYSDNRKITPLPAEVPVEASTTEESPAPAIGKKPDQTDPLTATPSIEPPTQNKPVEVKRRTAKLSSTSRPVFQATEEGVKIDQESKAQDAATATPTLPAPKPVAPSIIQQMHAGELRTGSLNLDDVISEYIKRSSEQERLDLRVVAPSVFIAGKNITLRIEARQAGKIEPDAIITVKVIGTAFKPQVYIGRAGEDGMVAFNLTLPAFTSGTAAIVIEAQSRFGRGELKQLIRKA